MKDPPGQEGYTNTYIFIEIGISSRSGNELEDIIARVNVCGFIMS